MNTFFRDNRSLPDDYQLTFCLCEECGEAYEASYEHICRRKNSYPQHDHVVAMSIRGNGERNERKYCTDE